MTNKDTASQSQAVPSELASLTRYGLTMHEAGFDHLVQREEGSWVKFADLQSLFSHSAATGKQRKTTISPEMKAALDKAAETGALVAETPDGIAFINRGHDYGDNSHLECTACGGSGHIEDQQARAASPAAPLAGKAEEDQKAAFTEYAQWCAANKRVPMAYSAFAELAAAVPAEEAKNGEDGYVCPAGKAQALAPAEPAPIMASALTDERIKCLWREATEGNHGDATVEYVNWFARAIEREVLAKPTSQGTAQSIDCDAFWILISSLSRAKPGAEYMSARSALLEFINRHIAAQAPAGRDAVLLDFLGGPAVVRLHQYEPIEGEAYIAIDLDLPGSPTVRGATVREAIDSAIRALKSHAAEQTDGNRDA